jgi:hypothetical protein
MLFAHELCLSFVLPMTHAHGDEQDKGDAAVPPLLLLLQCGTHARAYSRTLSHTRTQTRIYIGDRAAIGGHRVGLVQHR